MVCCLPLLLCAAAVVIFGATGTVGHQMLDFIVKQNVMGDSVKVSCCGSPGVPCSMSPLQPTLKRKINIMRMCCNATCCQQGVECFIKCAAA
jgi:hypothetical protein